MISPLPLLSGLRYTRDSARTSKIIRYRPRILCDLLLRYFYSLFLILSNGKRASLLRQFSFETPLLLWDARVAILQQRRSRCTRAFPRKRRNYAAFGRRPFANYSYVCLFNVAMIRQASSKLQSYAMRGPQFPKARMIRRQMLDWQMKRFFSFAIFFKECSRITKYTRTHGVLFREFLFFL